MKTNTIYQIVGIAALSAGAVAVGMSAWARIKKRKDQKEIQDATQEAAALNENFSGASGVFARKNLKRNYIVGFDKRGVPVIVNTGDVKKKGPYIQCYKPYKLVNGWCVKEQKATLKVN